MEKLPKWVKAAFALSTSPWVLLIQTTISTHKRQWIFATKKVSEKNTICKNHATKVIDKYLFNHIHIKIHSERSLEKFVFQWMCLLSFDSVYLYSFPDIWNVYLFLGSISRQMLKHVTCSQTLYTLFMLYKLLIWNKISVLSLPVYIANCLFLMTMYFLFVTVSWMLTH